ncbi:MAG: recombinase family protein [Clostridia bacterium]|nr:recombinase family protein [Clostridia bacterium]
MCKIYGYCRISTRKQSIDRQIRNIQTVYPNAIIIKEVFTGTKFQGRKELDKVLAKVTIGDIIIFDSVSRMSRNADEGIALYMDLYDKGVNLVFLKEPHINTETYKSALSNEIQLTGGDVDDILIGINSYLKKLARKQIRLAFEQSEKEVEDLHQRTKEGMETARLNGKQIGNVKGVKLTTKKSIASKKIIEEHAIDFGGTLKDVDVIKLTGLSRNTYYKYKRELITEK